jgi:hypothetical protein
MSHSPDGFDAQTILDRTERAQHAIFEARLLVTLVHRTEPEVDEGDLDLWQATHHARGSITTWLDRVDSELADIYVAASKRLEEGRS